MKVLVTGGSASGKSAYAEALALKLGGPLFYIATMKPWDQECLSRIEKHRLQRRGKGFETVESYGDLRDISLPERGTVLLECMGNLTANVLFGENPPPSPFDAISQGLLNLESQCESLVVVSNAVSADGVSYEATTISYLALLGKLDAHLARRFDRVVEVVCGIALGQKGEVL